MSAPGDDPDDDPDDGVADARAGSGRSTQPGDASGRAGARPGEADPPAREEWRSAEERSDDEESGGNGWGVFVRDAVSSVLAVLVIGAYLFAVSGVWPPLVAVESTSMVPNMQVNDLVFVMEPDRFPGEGAHEGTGVVTARTGQHVEYRKFGGYGDVIVYAPGGNGRRVPIIHRAMFWVNTSENWYDEADPNSMGASECGDSPDEGLPNCPAPHAGFITKGDNNGRYDQVSGLSGPVRPSWVVGTAELRIPGLGWIRLQSQAAPVNATDRPAGAAPDWDG
jgi:signal peptidase